MSNTSMGHPIRVVVQRTGLNAATLRAWERRYQVVEPTRSEGGHRLYSTDDIGRLRRLVQAVDGGRSIGQIAKLGDDELDALIQADRLATGPTLHTAIDSGPVDEALSYVRELDSGALSRLLMRASVSQRPSEMVSGLLVPLLHNIGGEWREGRLSMSAEHLASVTLRRHCEWLTGTVQVDGVGALVVTGTPSGQRHEFGALLAGVIAAGEGWQVRFLGPDLPTSEIIQAAHTLEASMIALSAVHPDLSPEIVAELSDMPEKLPAWVDVVIGGNAAQPHASVLAAAGVQYHDSLEMYRRSLRERGRPGARLQAI